MTTNDTQDRDGIIGGALTVALLITLAVQNAVPPMATDMYSAAFPQITADLATNSTMLGFTLTTFFVGYATGQVLGGAISDQIGRRRPIIAGGIIALVGSIICVLTPNIWVLLVGRVFQGLVQVVRIRPFVGYATGQVLGGAISDQIGRRRPIIAGGIIALVGSMICVFTPNIWVLLVGRVFQGLGGGVASSVARAILVDVAHGKTLARAMSLIQAIVGFAPMLAPVLGAFIITHATWRVVFWALAAFTLLMAALAWFVVPESLPEDRRHPGGIPRFFSGLVQVVRIRPFVGFMLTNTFSSFCMFGYISNATYVLQGPLGLSPMAFAWVFAFNALLSTGFALVNVRLISHFTPRTLIVTGLTIAATGVVTLAISTFLLDLPLILTCVGFALVMTANAFIFGNSGAQAMSEAREHAGTASSVMGVFQSIANGIAAPLATSGGDSAVPMVLVMIVGSVGAWFAFWVIARGGKHTPRHLSLD